MQGEAVKWMEPSTDLGKPIPAGVCRGIAPIRVKIKRIVVATLATFPFPRRSRDGVGDINSGQDQGRKNLGGKVSKGLSLVKEAKGSIKSDFYRPLPKSVMRWRLRNIKITDYCDFSIANLNFSRRF